jgi:gag-polypeptide of LTR copia-type
MSGIKVTTIEKLSAENHEWWFDKMRNLLIIGGLWFEFVEDVIPPTDKEYSKQKSAQCVAYIALNVSEHHYAEIKNITVPEQLWRTLQKKYSARGAAAKFDLLQQLSSFKKEPGRGACSCACKLQAARPRRSKLSCKW